MTPEEIKIYQHNYWLATIADKEKHAAKLKHRRENYKLDSLKGRTWYQRNKNKQQQ